MKHTIPRQAWIPPAIDSEVSDEGPWMPFVGPLLETISDRVRDDTEYVIDDDNRLLSLMVVLDATDREAKHNSCLLLRGHAGSGKTSFLKHWIGTSATFLRARAVIEDGFHDDTRWHPKTLETKYQDNARAIGCRLHEHGRKALPKEQQESFDLLYRARVADLQKRKFAHTLLLDEFLEGFTNQSKRFQELYPGLNGSMYLATVTSCISEVTGRAVWIILDNVDLLGLDHQRKLFSFAESMRRDIIDKCETSEWICRLCVMTVVRHETALHHKNGAFLGFTSKDFPPPSLRKIAIRKIEKAIDKETREYDREGKSIDFQIEGRTFHNWNELGNVLAKKIGIAISISSKRQADEWHDAVVSHDARRFFNTWSRIILSRISALEWLFAPEDVAPSVNEYERLLYRGGRHEYPGMHQFSPGADNSFSPLVVNVFNPGIRNYGSRKDVFANLWAPIRILQYVAYHCIAPKPLSDVVSELSIYFDRSHVLECLRFFIWARLIDETELGARNIGDAVDWHALRLADDLSENKVMATFTTKLYVDDLMKDFGYVSTIAIVSLIDADKIRDRSVPLTKFTQVPLVYRFPIIFAFYETLLVGLLENIKHYKANGTIGGFESVWMTSTRSTRPWLDGIDQARDVLSRIGRTTIQSAEGVSRSARETATKLDALKRHGISEIQRYIQIEL